MLNGFRADGTARFVKMELDITIGHRPLWTSRYFSRSWSLRKAGQSEKDRKGAGLFYGIWHRHLFYCSIKFFGYSASESFLLADNRQPGSRATYYLSIMKSTIMNYLVTTPPHVIFFWVIVAVFKSRAHRGFVSFFSRPGETIFRQKSIRVPAQDVLFLIISGSFVMCIHPE